MKITASFDFKLTIIIHEFPLKLEFCDLRFFQNFPFGKNLSFQIFYHLKFSRQDL